MCDGNNLISCHSERSEESRIHKKVNVFEILRFSALRFFLDSYTRGDAKGGGDSSEYRDDDVEDFTPKVFVFHKFLVFKFH